jgi:hypothetical protein
MTVLNKRSDKHRAEARRRRVKRTLAVLSEKSGRRMNGRAVVDSVVKYYDTLRRLAHE